MNCKHPFSRTLAARFGLPPGIEWAPVLRYISAFALIVALTPKAWSQEERPWKGHIRLGGVTYQNFFWEPDDYEQHNVQAAEAAAEISFAMDEAQLTEVYGDFAVRSYRQLSTTPAFGVGVRRKSRPHAFDVYVDLERGRPQADVGDRPDKVDTLSFSGEYSCFVSRNWQAYANLILRDQELELRSGNDNRLLYVGGSLRYRGFGYRFSPEIGIMRGRRKATDPNESISAWDPFFKIRLIPHKRVYISVTYRHRQRNYTVGSESGSNFGRQDLHRQLSVTSSYAVHEGLDMIVYYAYLNSDSTKESRIFSSQIVNLSLGIGF